MGWRSCSLNIAHERYYLVDRIFFLWNAFRYYIGFITVSVRVYNPKDLTKFKDVELLVDGGALHMSILKNTLKELGILPMRKSRYETFEGRGVERCWRSFN